MHTPRYNTWMAQIEFVNGNLQRLKLRETCCPIWKRTWFEVVETQIPARLWTCPLNFSSTFYRDMYLTLILQKSSIHNLKSIHAQLYFASLWISTLHKLTDVAAFSTSTSRGCGRWIHCAKDREFSTWWHWAMSSAIFLQWAYCCLRFWKLGSRSWEIKQARVRLSCCLNSIHPKVNYVRNHSNVSSFVTPNRYASNFNNQTSDQDSIGNL